MIISGFEQTNLITAAHQGTLETPLWSSFLRQLREQSAADVAMLILRRREGAEIATIQSSPGENNSEQYDEQSSDSFSTSDPVPYAALRAERAYAIQEFLQRGDDASLERSPEGVIPAKYRYARIIRVQEPSGYNAWIVIARQNPDFAGGDSARLSAAAPHFSIALRTFAAIERERLNMQISNQAIESLNFGWITLDQNGVIIDLDRQAEGLISKAGAIRRSVQGKLQPASRDAQGQLAKLLRDISAGKSPPATAIHLSDNPWLDMLVTPPKNPAQMGSAPAALIAYIHGDQQPGQERVEQISGLFGLTNQEAKLALALSRGRSIAESASDQNISVHTARLYSKRIYAKTDTRGQADLVRLILSSIMAL